jgi:hypothetical protein
MQSNPDFVTGRTALIFEAQQHYAAVVIFSFTSQTPETDLQLNCR